MYSLTATRSKLLDALTGKRVELARQSTPDEILNSETEAQIATAVWMDDPRTQPALPVLLVTPDGRTREWMGWIATYLKQIRPFTAFCRVIERSELTAFGKNSLNPPSSNLVNALVGLVLGELLFTTDFLRRDSAESITFSDCAGSLSFVLARAAILGNKTLNSNADILAQCSEKWQRARQLTRQQEYAFPIQAIIDIVETISNADSGHFPNLLFEKIYTSTFLEDGVNSEVLKELSRYAPIDRILTLMQGTREERVACFEDLCREFVPHSSMSARETALLLGYLASRIAPGSLTHTGLLVPWLKKYPTAMLWYSVLAALVKGNLINGELSGLGYRINREFLNIDTELTRPRADISLLELEILLGGDRVFDSFITNNAWQLVVELSPGVCTVLRWAVGPNPSAKQEDDYFPIRARIAVARELDMIRKQLGNLSNHLLGESNPRPQPDAQRELFSPDKRGRKR